MAGAQWGEIAHPNSITIVGARYFCWVAEATNIFGKVQLLASRNIVGGFYNNDDSGIYAGGSDYVVIVDSNKTAGNKIYFAVWNGR